MDFGAGVKMQGDMLDELLQEGHHLVPTLWVDLYKGDEVKSRLVACGQLGKDRNNFRPDAPTSSLEGFNQMSSFAACNRLRLKCADLSNAYFQGEKMDRLLLLNPRRCGLPGEGENYYMMAANVPIYGTGDACIILYKAFPAAAIAPGFRE